jgi:hypothetical protein
MTLFATSTVRVLYKLPFGEKDVKSVFRNSNPVDALKSGGKLNMTE